MGGFHIRGVSSGSANGVMSGIRDNNRGQVTGLWCDLGWSHMYTISSICSTIRTTDLIRVRTQDVTDFA